MSTPRSWERGSWLWGFVANVFFFKISICCLGCHGVSVWSDHPRTAFREHERGNAPVRCRELAAAGMWPGVLASCGGFWACSAPDFSLLLVSTSEAAGDSPGVGFPTTHTDGLSPQLLGSWGQKVLLSASCSPHQDTPGNKGKRIKCVQSCFL